MSARQTEAALVAAGAGQPPQASALPAPTGNNALVNTPLPQSGPGFYSTVAAGRRFGQAAAIQVLQAIAKGWQQAHPQGPRIGIGDLSHQGGGPMSKHKSHQTGLDVDIRLPRNDGREAPSHIRDAAYSRALTQDLVNRILNNGILRVEYIFFNDRAVSGVNSKTGHDNHLHVRFFPPSASAPAPTPVSGGLVGVPAAPGTRGSRAGMPPIEGPYKGVTGQHCSNGRSKCWFRHTFDIIDEDAPWNDPANRSPANYAAALDYLNVDNPGNVRFWPAGGKTYCNIYAHDATRMMWASIPHWIRDASQPNGWNELGANATYKWMLANSRGIGWVHIDERMCRWIREQADRQQSLDPPDPTIPAQIGAAGARLSAVSPPSPDLFAQPGYVAQQFANLGLPVVIVWRNPKPGRSGHMAMVRPESPNARGLLKSGVFYPRSAQAGARNFRNEPASWIGSNYTAKGVMFYVHA